MLRRERRAIRAFTFVEAHSVTVMRGFDSRVFGSIFDTSTRVSIGRVHVFVDVRVAVNSMRVLLRVL